MTFTEDDEGLLDKEGFEKSRDDRAETMHACVLLFFIKQNGARREEQCGSGEITFTVTNRKNIVTLSYN